MSMDHEGCYDCWLVERKAGIRKMKNESRYQMSLEEAHKKKKCMHCEEKVKLEILDETAQQKYQVTGYCELCWDIIFLKRV